jgi:hypothetical protein
MKNVVRIVDDNSSPAPFHPKYTIPFPQSTIYIPAEVPAGAKAEAEAKRARRAKIDFIMVEIV